ncbi:methyl-accepting chemotaxis protein [Lacrimispora sp.]|uniref:methyl-accepting chemotaxis protein n=1 Tax=Lacrimispora sp. TaxID=2719234 RepID=UPI0029E215E1|nr:methyl-accepting chemotaxis protein [Lacrimispora sp.]
MKKWFEDLKVAKKLLISYLLISALTVVTAGVGIVSVTAAAVNSNARNVMAAVIIIVFISIAAIILSVSLSRYMSDIIAYPLYIFEAFAGMAAVGDFGVDKIAGEKERAWASRKDEVGGLASAFDQMIINNIEQAQTTRTIADGDLTTVVTIRSEEDILGKALAELVEKFHNLASSITTIAEQVNSGSGQVSDGAQALSSGTTEQAATLEELNASISSVARQASKNAESVEKAAGYVGQAGQGVMESNQLMQEGVKSGNERDWSVVT